MVRTRWWEDWPFRRTDENLSILDVVKFGTVDFKLAGLLWLLMEHRASVIVASGPIWAGKTTLLNALLDFLRPEIEQVALRGYDEDFKSLGTGKPENTYLIAEEISNHSYEYLWGYQVVKAFECIPKGYALGGTTHARNVKEVAYVLNALGVPQPLIAGLGAVVTIQVARSRYNDDEPLRYVDSVSTLGMTEEGLVAYNLAARRLPGEDFVYLPEPALHRVLLDKFKIGYDSVTPEIESRGELLSSLYLKDDYSRRVVKKAVSDYYRKLEG
jgi:hypothetical protein